MIDPVTTAPVVEDDLSSDEGQGDGVDENGGNMSYNSTDNNCSRKHDHASRMDEAEQGMFMLGLTRNNSIVPPAVQEATEAIVDYASFIWEIAAQRSPAPASHELMVIGISIFWLVLITFVVFTQQILDESTRLLIVGVHQFDLFLRCPSLQNCLSSRNENVQTDPCADHDFQFDEWHTLVHLWACSRGSIHCNTQWIWCCSGRRPGCSISAVPSPYPSS